MAYVAILMGTFQTNGPLRMELYDIIMILRELPLTICLYSCYQPADDVYEFGNRMIYGPSAGRDCDVPSNTPHPCHGLSDTADDDITSRCDLLRGNRFFACHNHVDVKVPCLFNFYRYTAGVCNLYYRRTRYKITD